MFLNCRQNPKCSFVEDGTELFKSACCTCGTLIFPHSESNSLFVALLHLTWSMLKLPNERRGGHGGCHKSSHLIRKKTTMISARSECSAWELFVLTRTHTVLWETTMCKSQIWNPVEHVNERRLNSTFLPQINYVIGWKRKNNCTARVARVFLTSFLLTTRSVSSKYHLCQFSGKTLTVHFVKRGKEEQSENTHNL